VQGGAAFLVCFRRISFQEMSFRAAGFVNAKQAPAAIAPLGPVFFH